MAIAAAGVACLPLVVGDFDMSSIGTVTHIEGKRVYGDVIPSPTADRLSPQAICSRSRPMSMKVMNFSSIVNSP